MIIMAYYSKNDAQLFSESAKQLPFFTPIINTFFLITSGFFLALSLENLKKGNLSLHIKYYSIAIAFGVCFLLVKTFEFILATKTGHGFGVNTFFNFYWMLTGFHYLHVLIGWIILVMIKPKAEQIINEEQLENLDAAAAFWHFCDLVWVLLFPTVYYLFR